MLCETHVITLNLHQISFMLQTGRFSVTVPNVMKSLSVSGPDSDRRHEAWTPKETTDRNQQASLHRLAA